MKRIVFPFLLVLIIVILSGCNNESDERIKMPSSSKKYKGVNYQEVITELQEAGFTNIETLIIDDLIIGWLTKDGEVEQVEVNGDTTFSTDSKYAKDVKIVITYHTFSEKTTDEKVEIETPEPSAEKITYANVDVETPEPSVEETSYENVEAETSEPSADKSEDIANVNLTIENNEDLAAILLAKGEFNPLYIDFAEKYKGQVIEFDGHIDYIVNYDGRKTRWDILLSVGDWIDEDTVSPGPIFKFEDVSLYDLGIEDLFLPEFVSVGSDIHIVAKIKEYREISCLFFLKPISLEAR